MSRLPSFGLSLCMAFSGIPPVFAKTAEKNSQKIEKKIHVTESLRKDAQRLRAYGAALTETPAQPWTLNPEKFSVLLRPLEDHLETLEEQNSRYPNAVHEIEESVASSRNLFRFVNEDRSYQIQVAKQVETTAGLIDRLLYDLEAVGFGESNHGPPGRRLDHAKMHPVDKWLPGAVEALSKFSQYGEAEPALPGKSAQGVTFKSGVSLLVRADGMIVEKSADGVLTERGLIRPSAQQALMNKKGTADIDIFWGDRETEEIIGSKHVINFESGETEAHPIFGEGGNARFTTSPIDWAVGGVFAPALTYAFGVGEVKKAVRRDIKNEVYDTVKVKEIENPFARAAAEFGLDVAMSKPVDALLGFGSGLPGWASSLFSLRSNGKRGAQFVKDVRTVFTSEDKKMRDDAYYRLAKSSLHYGKKMLGMTGGEPERNTAPVILANDEMGSAVNG